MSVVRSFDVFDTTITRLWYEPSHLFLAMAIELRQNGLFAGPPSEWQRLRVKAERQARRLSVFEEVRLSEIYQVIAARLSWSETETDSAIALECKLELSSSFPIKETIKLINAHSSAGGEYFFVSDSYMGPDFVRSLLEKHGLKVAPNDLYVSSILRSTKRTGNLFRLILRERQLRPRDLIHSGDNIIADIAKPKALGIITTHFQRQSPTRYERLAMRTSAAPILWRSAAAGSARAARLSESFDNLRDNTTWSTATNVAGPTLTAFVLWILLAAKEKHIDRLYFLARDGQLLSSLAQLLNSTLNLGIQCHYLFASRQALFLPAIRRESDLSQRWIFDDLVGKPVERFLKRVGLVRSEVALHLERFGLSLGSSGNALSLDDLTKLRGFIADPHISTLILEKSRTQRSLLLDYLKEKDFSADRSCAIVDLGWHGRLQQALAKSLSTNDGAQAALVGFYFSLFGPPHTSGGQFHRYVDTMKFNGVLLETFCAANHGTVLSYERSPTGSATAVVASAENNDLGQWRLDLHQRGVLAFAKTLASALQPNDLANIGFSKFLSEWSLGCLNLFTSTPDPIEADTIGSILHSDDQSHTNPTAMAPSVGFIEKLLYTTFLRRYASVNSYWIEGSISRSTTNRATRRAWWSLWQIRSRLRDALIGQMVRRIT